MRVRGAAGVSRRDADSPSLSERRDDVSPPPLEPRPVDELDGALLELDEPEPPPDEGAEPPPVEEPPDAGAGVAAGAEPPPEPPPLDGGTAVGTGTCTVGTGTGACTVGTGTGTVGTGTCTVGTGTFGRFLVGSGSWANAGPATTTVARPTTMLARNLTASACYRRPIFSKPERVSNAYVRAASGPRVPQAPRHEQQAHRAHAREQDPQCEVGFRPERDAHDQGERAAAAQLGQRTLAQQQPDGRGARER